MSHFGSPFDDSPPRKDFWLPFKVSTLERLIQMQKGLLYMNSLEYFANLKDEENLPLRMDEAETVYGVLRAGSHDHGYSTISIKIGDGKEVDLGPKAVITASFPRPRNYMLFCMGAFADGRDGTIPGEVGDRLDFDERFLNFGSHVLVIRAPTEFGIRISNAIASKEGLFGSRHFHGGYGLVDYKPLKSHSGPKGLFTKDIKYAWQRELRLVLGVEDRFLNSRGAFELCIGDLSDISSIVSVQALLDEPILVKRRRYRMIDGKPVQVMD